MSSALRRYLCPGPSSAWFGARLCLLGNVPVSAVEYFMVKASRLEALAFGRKCFKMYYISEKVIVTVYPGD